MCDTQQCRGLFPGQDFPLNERTDLGPLTWITGLCVQTGFSQALQRGTKLDGTPFPLLKAYLHQFSENFRDTVILFQFKYVMLILHFGVE